MVVKTTVERLDLTDLLSDLTPKAQSASVADFAKDRLAEAQSFQKRAGGRAAKFAVTVDGRTGASIDSVRPNGRIVIEFELVTELLAWIARALWERSPVGSGRYRSGHTLYADGRPIGALSGGVLPGHLPDAREYSFSNVQPYAHKIEIGRTHSGRAFTIHVPNRVYERTASDAAARFPGLGKVVFAERAVVAGVLRRARKSPGETSYPTIVVT